MAIVQLKDVTVQFVNQGKGFKVLEESTSGGRTFKQQFTVWADEGHGYSVGDVISVSGFLGAKVGRWTDREGNERQSVELSINSPRFGSERAQEPAGGGYSGSASEYTGSNIIPSDGRTDSYTSSGLEPF